jgi:hypothetical protein
MKLLPKTGLPRLDQASWDKGFADGFRGNVWWPGPGTEPLSYASGYTEAQVERGTRRVVTAPARGKAPLAGSILPDAMESRDADRR